MTPDLAAPVDADDHRRGVTGGRQLVVYSDFECPYTAAAMRDIGRLLEGGRALEVIFRHFPLREIHPHAQAAAEEAEAAARQDRFWEMHDLLFRNQLRLEPADLRRYAERLDLDPERFEADISDPAIKARVERDAESGEGSGVDGTPSPATAPVTLVEYGDYQCPYCRAAMPILEELQQILGDQLRYVFRQLPLTALHPHAQHAAEAAEATAAQGRFSEMHSALFEHQEALEDDHLVQYPAGLDLDTARTRRELGRIPTRAGSVRTSSVDSTAACGGRPPSTWTTFGMTGSSMCARS